MAEVAKCGLGPDSQFALIRRCNCDQNMNWMLLQAADFANLAKVNSVPSNPSQPWSITNPPPNSVFTQRLDWAWKEHC